MIIRRVRTATFALATIASLSLSGLSTAPSRATGTVTIGVVADVTGASSVYGTSIRNGATLAAALLNKAGGVNGNTLNIKLGDAASSETQAIDLFQQYSGDSTVLAILGPTLSSEALKADPLAQQAGIPVLATSNTAKGIVELGDYIFRLALGEARVIPLAMQTAQKHLHFRKVAIIYANDNTLTSGEAQIFQAAAKALNLTVVDTETFATKDKDFSTQLTKIKGAHPDAILAGALAPAAVPLMVQARQLGIPASVTFIGGNGFNSPAVIAGAGKAAEGAVAGTAWFANGKGALNQRFIAAYKAAYGKAPDQFAAQAFDGVNVLAAGVTKAHTTSDRKALRAALATLSGVPVVTGASGSFSFTATRDSGEQGTVQIIRNGQFVQYT